MWFAFRVPPQKEISGTKFLIERGVDAFSPFEQRFVRQRGKKSLKPIERTLLYGYVLINVSEGSTPWDMVHKFGILKSVVGYGGTPRAIKELDIEHMKSVSGKITGRATAPLHMYVEGQHVRITTGPLQGLKAVVASSKGDKIKIKLETYSVMGTGTVDIKSAALEAA